MDEMDELQLALLGLVKIGYQYRHVTELWGVESWTAWEMVRPVNAGDTVERMVTMYQQFIRDGYKYQLRTVYATKEVD